MPRFSLAAARKHQVRHPMPAAAMAREIWQAEPFVEETRRLETDYNAAMANDVTQILQSIERGDRQAAAQLLPLVYDELRRLAASKMNQEKPGQTLQPTALVHEAFVRLVGNQDPNQWDGRAHFFGAASEAMRRILIDNARRRGSQKRGGDWVRHELGENDVESDAPNIETLISLDEALTKLAHEDESLAKLVELRYFTGLTIEETAEILGVSPRTTKRNWAYARAWLRREMDGEESLPE